MNSIKQKSSNIQSPKIACDSAKQNTLQGKVSSPRPTNEYVRNPISNRPIKIGGATFRSLIAKRIIVDSNSNNTIKDSNRTRTFDSEVDKVIKEKSYDMKQRVKSNHTAGKYSEFAANSSINIINKIRSGDLVIPSNLSKNKAHEYIKNLIYNDMLTNDVTVPSRFKSKKNKSKRIKCKVSGKVQPSKFKVQPSYVTDTDTEDADGDIDTETDTNITEIDSEIEDSGSDISQTYY